MPSSLSNSAWFDALRRHPASLLVALIVASLPVAPKLTEWVMTTAGIAAVGAWLYRRALVADPDLRLLRIAFAGAVVMALCSTAVVLTLHYGARQIYTVWYFLAVPLLLAVLAHEPRMRAWIGAGAAVGAMVLLASGWATLEPGAVARWGVMISGPDTGGDPRLLAQRMSGLMVFPTLFAMVGVPLSLAALLMALRERAPALRLLGLAGFAAGGLAVLLSLSRGPFLGWLAATVVLAVGEWWPRLGRRARQALVALALLVLLAAAVLMGPALLHTAESIQSYFAGGNPVTSEGGRLSAWLSLPTLLTLGIAPPWLGLGPDMLPLHLERLYAGTPKANPIHYVPHMHNEWLEVLVSRGLLALAGYLAWQGALVAWAARRERASQGRLSGTAALLLAYGAIGLIDVPFTFVQVMLPMVLLVAVVAAREPH